MIESLLLVIYTGTVFLVFLWLMQNDDKPDLSEQTGIFRISSTARTGANADGRARASRNRCGQTGMGEAAEAESSGDSTDPSAPRATGRRTRARHARGAGRGSRHA